MKVLQGAQGMQASQVYEQGKVCKFCNVREVHKICMYGMQGYPNVHGVLKYTNHQRYTPSKIKH